MGILDICSLLRREFPCVLLKLFILVAISTSVVPANLIAALSDNDPPNILLIICDDVAYGAPTTFGGTIPTPTLDRIAQNGLRYTNFHSNALSSTSRATLITGRNYHTVDSAAQNIERHCDEAVIAKETATIGEILKQNGYSTAWFGKDHNTPAAEATANGPFDNWPEGYGFQHFYGFIGSDTSQWQPNLFSDRTAIQPYLNEKGWNLTSKMADAAIAHLKKLDRENPKQKFFLYYAPGGVHPPHHPTPEWIAKFKGQFDHGWEKQRERIFANQKKLGIIPPDAEAAKWPEELPRWESLPSGAKMLFARQAEVYAAYLAYSDHEIGRVIRAIDEIGKGDNTLIIYISGDNGCISGKSLLGTPNEVASCNGVQLPVQAQMQFYDLWGSDQTYPHMASSWEWAFDSPYQWEKQATSHYCATAQGLVIAWPKGIDLKGVKRTQFHHLVDIVPTILDVVGLSYPPVVNSTPQRPLEGISLTYTWTRDAEATQSKHKTQYFDLLGNKALYHEGWLATTAARPPSWLIGGKERDNIVDGYCWELYNIDKDSTQRHNLALAMPKKLEEMRKLVVNEERKAERREGELLFADRSESGAPPLKEEHIDYVFSTGGNHIPQGAAPSVLNKSYIISAEVDLPDEGAEGVIVTQGGRFGGYALYLLRGKPLFVWNVMNLERVRWEGSEPLPAGLHTISFEFSYDGSGSGNGGVGVLKVDGQVVSSNRMTRSVPSTLQWDEAFDIGRDSGTSVEESDYSVPFPFNGNIIKVTVSPNN